jgi:hypothetical protein
LHRSLDHYLDWLCVSLDTATADGMLSAYRLHLSGVCRIAVLLARKNILVNRPTQTKSNAASARERKMNKFLSAGALATLLILMGAFGALAQGCPDSPDPNCIIISQCQKISQSGVYVIDGNNSVNQGHLTLNGPECITVAAPNVNLTLFHPLIDGQGHGIGVHVLKAASGFLLNGDTGGVFENLDIGVKVDASGAKILPGNFDEPLTYRNDSIGILLNRVRGVTLGNFGFGPAMSGYQTAVKIQGGGGNSLGPWMDTATHNPGWGGLTGPGVAVDIEHSNGNTIEGLYVTGGSGVVISRNSHNNTIDLGFLQQGAVGVEIKRGASHNAITNNVAMSNQMDLLDDNRKCPNTWTGNTFSTAEPAACVH